MGVFIWEHDTLARQVVPYLVKNNAEVTRHRLSRRKESSKTTQKEPVFSTLMVGLR
jgi:hypothetical protein